MPKHYVTFGQRHTHRINGITLDCDSVASYEAKDYSEGRKKAFELFDDKFCIDYHDKEFNMDDLKYFPRGIIEIDKKMKLTPELKEFLEEQGYFELKEVNGKILGLMKFLFTIAIVVDINEMSYDHRYCYPYEKSLECLMAYKVYEGEGDPIGGWIKNKGWNRDRLNPKLETIK